MRGRAWLLDRAGDAVRSVLDEYKGTINFSGIRLGASTRTVSMVALVQQVCAAERLTRFHLETHN